MSALGVRRISWTADALAIIRERYADFGPSLACEKLRESHGLTLAAESVRHLMTEAGLWIPRKQRPPKIYQPRNRRSCLGELIQIDDDRHRASLNLPWLEHAGMLHAFVGTSAFQAIAATHARLRAERR